VLKVKKKKSENFSKKNIIKKNENIYDTKE